MRIHEYTHLFTYVRSVPFLKTPRDPRQKTYEQRNHFSVLTLLQIGCSRQFVDSSAPSNSATIGEQIISLSIAALFLGYRENANILEHQTSTICKRNSNYSKCHFNVFYTPHGSDAWRQLRTAWTRRCKRRPGMPTCQHSIGMRMVIRPETHADVRTKWTLQLFYLNKSEMCQ